MLFFFFFSSRRRHTRCSRDWSSDVCSSDLSRTARSEGNGRLGEARWGLTYKAVNSVSAEACARIKVMLGARRSEEHTSELQSRLHLVCRLLLEKKKT